MPKFWKKISVVLLILVLPSLVGCDKLDQIKVKMGLKNEDFEYIKQGKVSKIIIQSTRDKGFTFVVEDDKTIEGMYKILSSAKKAQNKTTLKPDYVFEMYENDESVHKFQYVVGIDKKSGGNLYDNQGKIYMVSSRLDNDIIKNFWNTRIPKKFQKVYYGSLLEVIKKYKNINSKDEIGIDINHDVEARKFLLSSNIEEFKLDLKDENINAKLMEDNNKEYNVNMSVTTEGYTPLLYKAVVKFTDKSKGKEKLYYIWDVYENSSWKIRIYEDKAPSINGKNF
ncbi:hypothetical protein ACER0A_002440 [Haloimpatiens sp. FM7315]|uniref:hypothetical protein n=1 Tax=Haloimpatiens sp. FM7315 TaxID=3298609 RepID=UPI0035A36BD9